MPHNWTLVCPSSFWRGRFVLVTLSQCLAEFLGWKRHQGHEHKVKVRYIAMLTITRPSLLCVTFRHKKRNYPVGSTVRYDMINYKVIPVGIDLLGQCMAILAGNL